VITSAGKKKSDLQRDELIEELHRVQADIDDARMRFNQATEKELVDQCVYEINALQARYTYFLRQIREHSEIGEAQG
jgi:hypothetical protein